VKAIPRVHVEPDDIAPVGFVLSDGVYSTLDFVDSTTIFTNAYGMNAGGMIVGDYLTSSAHQATS
jgi:hypothetical protein